MTYFEEIDEWIGNVILNEDEEDYTGDEWYVRVSKAIKAKLLESYNNGKKAALRTASSANDQKSKEERVSRRPWPRRQSRQS